MALVAEAVANAIVREGVADVFGLLGEGNIAVAQCLGENPAVRWYSARREDAVVCMADGYTRRRGTGVGFATVTCGPGLTNAVTALTEARKAGTPLVVLTGDTPGEEYLHSQAIDEQRFAAATGAGVHTVRSAATAVDDVAIAFGRARRERRPVVLVLPVDLVDKRYTGPRPEDCASGRGGRALHPADLMQEALADVVEDIRRARTPVIIAGHGAVVAGARDDLVGLAEAIGAPLVTTLRARGLFAGHALEAGMAGGFPEGPANDLLGQADLVLAFGSSLGNQTTKAGSLFDFDRVVRIDVDPSERVSDGAPRRELVADARRAAHALRLACAGDRAESGVRFEAATAALAARRAARRSRSAASGVFDASALALAVDSAAPIARNVVVDLGYFTPEACEYVRVDAPGKFLFPVNFGSIGLALPTAAGTSVADPTVPTLALVGDGGLMMSIGELETIARHELPVVVVVFDDRALGVEYHALRLRNGDPGFATFRDVDFAAVARGFGIDAVTVTAVEEIDEIGLQANRWASPLLIDAKIDGTVETEWLQGIVDAGWHRRMDA